MIQKLTLSKTEVLVRYLKRRLFIIRMKEAISMRKTRIIFMIMLLVFIAACTSSTERNVISASGTSTIKVDPDQAVFYLRIESLKPTAEESQTDNSERSEAVILALKEAGLTSDDISTDYYNLYKREDWSEDGPEFRGYQADHTLKVMVDEVADVGKYIDIAITNGADGLNSVNFELSDEKQKQVFKEALTESGSEAKEKAEVLASSVGAKLGKLVKVTDSSTNYYPVPIYRDMAVLESKGGAAGVPIQIKQIDVTATVSVDYEIK